MKPYSSADRGDQGKLESYVEFENLEDDKRFELVTTVVEGKTVCASYGPTHAKRSRCVFEWRKLYDRQVVRVFENTFSFKASLTTKCGSQLLVLVFDNDFQSTRAASELSDLHNYHCEQCRVCRPGRPLFLGYEYGDGKFVGPVNNMRNPFRVR